MKDLLGNEITEGCFIAYAIRSGNSGAMRIGKVIAPPVDDPEQCPKPYLQKVPIMGAVRYRWSDKWSLAGRRAYLYVLSNIVVIDEEDVPAELRALYESA